MLSTQTRLRLEDIAARISGGLSVTFDEMTWAQKWADNNRSAFEILQRARRRAIHGEPEKGSLDELLDGLNISDPNPDNHLIGPQDPDTWADYFKAPPWLKND
jgi:hypothetical protein